MEETLTGDVEIPSVFSRSNSEDATREGLCWRSVDGAFHIPHPFRERWCKHRARAPDTLSHVGNPSLRSRATSDDFAFSNYNQVVYIFKRERTTQRKERSEIPNFITEQGIIWSCGYHLLDGNWDISSNKGSSSWKHNQCSRLVRYY